MQVEEVASVSPFARRHGSGGGFRSDMFESSSVRNELWRWWLRDTYDN